MKVKICDICKQQRGSYAARATYKWYDLGKRVRSYDICFDCWRKFENLANPTINKIEQPTHGTWEASGMSDE